MSEPKAIYPKHDISPDEIKAIKKAWKPKNTWSIAGLRVVENIEPKWISLEGMGSEWISTLSMISNDKGHGNE